VARFLLDMGERPRRGTSLELPMSRHDIADYLGLTIETVSRTLTRFQGLGLIELEGARLVRPRTASALAELCA
jgi:CRP/FNR family nitrogen fixation transcriptional regulator